MFGATANLQPPTYAQMMMPNKLEYMLVREDQRSSKAPGFILRIRTELPQPDWQVANITSGVVPMYRMYQRVQVLLSNELYGLLRDSIWQSAILNRQSPEIQRILQGTRTLFEPSLELETSIVLMHQLSLVDLTKVSTMMLLERLRISRSEISLNELTMGLTTTWELEYL